MSTAGLLLYSAVAIAFLHTGSRSIPTNDLHIFLAMGHWMVDQRALLNEEIFTWTAHGTGFANGTWAFSVLSWLVFDALGLDGLRLFNGAMVALAVGLIARASLSADADPRAAAMAALYAWAMTLQNTVIRGQTWVFPLLGLLAWISARPRSNRLLVPAGVLIGFAWSNTHGSFPAGLAFIGALGVGCAWENRSLTAARTPLVLAAAMIVGVCIGPNGTGVWAYALENARLSRAREFVEWLPAPLWSLKTARLTGAFLLWGVLVYREKSRIPIAHLLILIGFGFLATTGSRFIAWFGLASSLPLAKTLSYRMTPERGVPTRLGYPIAGLLVVLWALFLIRGLAPPEQNLSDDTPIELVDAIAESASSGRILNPPEYGGYLSERLYPMFATSGDIRTWLYDDATWNIYLALSAAPEDWETTLDAYDVTHLLLWAEHHQDSLIPAAEGSTSWRLLAKDDFGAAFMRVQR